MKHTPGPWVAENRNVYSSDVTGSIVAQCKDFKFAPRPREEQEANARLMAAAPELLEVAKRVASRLPPEDGPCHVGITTQENCAHCRRILAVVALVNKIEGREYRNDFSVFENNR